MQLWPLHDVQEEKSSFAVATSFRPRERLNFGSGQEVFFCPSRPDPVRNAREQDGTRTGRDGPHLGTWTGPKHCKTKHMANLDGTSSDPGWDLDGPRIGPRRGSGWHPPETVTDF